MKNSKKGISLIVLVITIIVIIILAAAIILTLNNNNPIKEANDARYASDCANMQAVFTNTVAKIMAVSQSTISITKTTITDENLEAPISYTLSNPLNIGNTSGTIVFKAGSNNVSGGVLTTWVTGKALPDYTAGNESWTIDEEGTLTLAAPNGYTYPRVTETVTNP